MTFDPRARAREMANNVVEEWNDADDGYGDLEKRIHSALLAFAREVLTQEPDEGMWGGVARDIVMWMDCYDGRDQTPKNLFVHLERVGTEIPQWLRDEPAMQNLDHVPSKGTRAVIIYKAMSAHRAKSLEDGE